MCKNYRLFWYLYRLGQFISGTEQDFTQVMNRKAQDLGLNDTYFKNATGLPEAEHYSTAYDLAKLARSLIHDFPDIYSWYKQKTFTYNNVTQRNRNTLLGRSQEVDGIKTGYQRRAIALPHQVVTEDVIITLNALIAEARDDDHLKLIHYAYRAFDNGKSSIVMSLVNKGYSKDRSK